MRVRTTSSADLDALLDPGATGWGAALLERVDLVGTPLQMQPTEAIRVEWAGRKIGAVDRVDVAAAHDGQRLAFFLEWADADENREPGDNDQFADAAAVVMPAVNGAPIMTMGVPGLPVNAWYWSAMTDGEGRDVIAEGIGTSRAVGENAVLARGIWRKGRWRVVIARAMQLRSPEPLAQLAPGDTSQFGVVVWEGGHGERAGLKAFSAHWRELAIDSKPTTRRTLDD